MLQTTVAIGKNFLGTNAEQFFVLVCLKNASQGSPQKLRENHLFFLETLNWQYSPSEKLRIHLNLQKMQHLDPQPEPVCVEDGQRGSSALEKCTTAGTSTPPGSGSFCSRPGEHLPPGQPCKSIDDLKLQCWREEAAPLRPKYSFPSLCPWSPPELTQISVARKHSHTTDYSSWAESALLPDRIYDLNIVPHHQGEARRWDGAARAEVQAGL